MLTALDRAVARDRRRPGLALLGSGQAIEAVLTAVLNEVSVLPDDVDLVLDDYHLAESPEILPGMTFLLERLPPQLRLVISTRADPALPLARLRARGELTEIRAADLRFTDDETGTFLAGATGLDLDAGRRRRPRRPHRGLDRLAAARSALTARTRGPVCVHRRVRRRRPVRRGLPRRGGPRPPAGRGPRVPARDLDPRPALRAAVRRGVRGHRRRARCSSPWSAATCSSSRSTRSVAGTATTTSSPTCCAATCSPSAQATSPSCTGGRAVVRGGGGARRRRPTRPRGRRRRPGRRPGRAGDPRLHRERREAVIRRWVDELPTM